MASHPPSQRQAPTGSRPGDQHAVTAPLPDGHLVMDGSFRWTLSSIPAEAGRVAYVRHQARVVLSLWALDHLAADAELLLGELASNAVRHARTPFTVALSSDGHNLRGEVSDANLLPPQAHLTDDPDATNGRGLLLVDRIAERWGTNRLPHGKRVWFELAIPGQ